MNTGTRIRIAEMLSMNIPISMNIIFIRIRKKAGLSDRAFRYPANIEGIFCEAISQEKILAAAIIIITDAEIEALFLIISGKS